MTTSPRHDFAARLALAAMLLLLLAPLLSQALAPAEPRVSVTPHAAPSDHRDHGAEAGTAAPGGLPSDHDQMMLAECGYCVLLAHSPLAADRGFFIPPGRAGPALAPASGPRTGHRPPPLFPHALSRAPPRHARSFFQTAPTALYRA